MLRKLMSAALAAIMLITAVMIAPVSAETVGPYRDVPAGKWYSGAILTMYEKGIMTGKKADVFDPNGNVTRAEFVTILFRLSEEEFEGGENAFTDVKAGAWYGKNVLWAAECGLVKGYPDDTFRPNDSIKRSEMVTLLARYIEYKGIRVIPDSSAVKSFPDVKAGSFYAKSLETVRVSGLIKGDAAGNFRPNATATRAEAAVLFSRFLDMVALGEELEELKEPLPVITLNTETGKDVESKEEYILTDFSLTAEDGRDISVEDVSIRGRGNTAWRVPKKSYKLKFPSKICLMKEGEGETKAKDWTLIANHYDKSLIRNLVGYRMAVCLDGIEWTPYTEMVEVYLNGEYRGVYTLAEQVEVKKDRVNILDGDKDDNIGFFIELDFWSTGTYNVDYFKSMGIKYTIKSDFRDEDQVKALKCHLETVCNVIKEGDEEKIRSVVDIPSAVDMYIINEIYRDTDVGSGSSFMYFKEPQGQLYFGPVWDLDGAFGNATREQSTTGLYAGYNISPSGSIREESNIWFAALQTNSWFREEVVSRWNEVKDTLLASVGENLKPVYANIEQYEKNFTAWPVLNEQLSDEPPKSLRLTSCREKIMYVENWIADRIAWLDGAFNSDLFGKDFPADRTKIEPEITGSTDIIEDRSRWIVPDWYNADNIAQIYYDQIYDLCDTEDGRIFVTLGRRDTMTVENMNLVILEEFMGVDTSRYTLFFDEEQFARAKATYGGMGSGQKAIFELKTGIRDILTGEESEFETLVYTFKKDLSLDWKFGY
ncbi:MAG: CotH kinase family protein [Clostridia bacterium]|nr:CotH kinase family protein [Clostridia bacterium]